MVGFISSLEKFNTAVQTFAEKGVSLLPGGGPGSDEPGEAEIFLDIRP